MGERTRNEQKKTRAHEKRVHENMLTRRDEKTEEKEKAEEKKRKQRKGAQEDSQQPRGQTEGRTETRGHGRRATRHEELGQKGRSHRPGRTQGNRAHQGIRPT